MTTLGGADQVNQVRKKKKKSGGQKKKKGSKGKSNKPKTITLTRLNKETQQHEQVEIPHITRERSRYSSDSEDSSEGGGLDDENDVYADEGLKDYHRGGYHPVNIGENYHGRYRIVYKLGWGQFSTVWLAFDCRHSVYVALKFIKSARHYTEAAEDEISVMRVLTDANQTRCCRLLDNFNIVGPNGRHVVLVFPVLGRNLWNVIEEDAREGLPLSVVHAMSRQLLEGMAILHNNSIIHTDLKPENLALKEPEAKIREIMRGDREEAEPSSKPEGSETKDNAGEAGVIDEVYSDIVIVDFGNACWTHKHFTNDIQTTQYRAPEVILRAQYSTPCDMWSVACVIFELATGDQLFVPRASRKGYHSKDDDHLAQMSELLGRFPKSLIKNSRKGSHFFDSKGNLRRISSLKPWPLHQVLHEKYGFSKSSAQRFADFLAPMLTVAPSARATADEMLQHAWLSSGVEQKDHDQQQQREADAGEQDATVR